MDISRQSAKNKQAEKVAGIAQRNYNEIVEFLDKNWTTGNKAKTLDRMKQLDTALGNPAAKLNAIMVAGTNGKSITIHLTAKLLTTEGLKVGTFYAPHILTYNERIAINHEMIANKAFTDIANEVINASIERKLDANSADILTMIALKYFAEHNTDVVVLEASEGGTHDAVNICTAKVAAITRVTAKDVLTTDEQLLDMLKDMMGVVKKGTMLVSGDQSKNHLQMMQDLTEKQGGQWAMPIRKLVALPYPFEQLHGRCAALAERLAQMYVEEFVSEGSISADSLLAKPKGQRGRPTLEAKRQSELHPKKTLEQFWKDEMNELPGRFQILDKEKPTILLDTACNIDAFKNLLLGIRLLHYQRPLKGLTIVAAGSKNSLHNEEFSKLVRYFFKKTSGQMFICPIEEALPGCNEDESWDVEKVTNDIKSMKIKARACKNFEEALDLAKKSVDERHGLVVITGSQSIVNNYWKNKGIKKF